MVNGSRFVEGLLDSVTVRLVPCLGKTFLKGEPETFRVLYGECNRGRRRCRLVQGEVGRGRVGSGSRQSSVVVEGCLYVQVVGRDSSVPSVGPYVSGG